MTPPSIDAPSTGELWELLKTGRKFRALGKRESFALLRWGPMAVADLVAEWFETDLLQASVAARAIHGTAMGPWSAGTGAVLLLGAAIDPVPGGSSVTAVGGPGVVTRAMAEAAREAGAEIRTGADVAAHPRQGRRASPASCSPMAPRSPAATVVSGADPRRTFLRPDRSGGARAGFHDADPELPLPRHGREAELRLARTAGVSRRRRAIPRRRSRGRVHIGPGIDYLERAFDASKYGETSPAPYLDVAFPSVARSLDGAGGPPRHVGAHAVRALHAAHRIVERAVRTRWPTSSCARSRPTRPA